MFRKIGLAVVVLVAGVATPTFAQVVVSCPFNPASGDNSSRGFYVTNYPASTLATVTLEMIPFAPGAVTDTSDGRARRTPPSGPTRSLARACTSNWWPGVADQLGMSSPPLG